jgi:hypothetical protein
MQKQERKKKTQGIIGGSVLDTYIHHYELAKK